MHVARRRKEITLQDLSERLGISRFTISKALSGKEGMSEKTRDLIIRTARELGYPFKGDTRRPDQRSTLAVVIPSRFISEFSYFADLLQGAESAAREAGCLLGVVGIDRGEEQAGKVPPSVLEADGAIYLPMIDAAWMEQALAEGPPAVLVNFPHRSWPVDSVVWDAQSGAAFCVDHLVKHGHRRIGYVGLPEVAPGYRLRWIGFQEALREHGLTMRESDRFFPVAWPPESCLASMRELLGRCADLPEALVCDFETTALSTLRALTELGRQDVVVACADQLSPSTLLTTSIPHIYYHRDWVGRRAVERLLRRIASPDEPYEQIRVAVRLRI